MFIPASLSKSHLMLLQDLQRTLDRWRSRDSFGGGYWFVGPLGNLRFLYRQLYFISTSLPTFYIQKREP